MRIWGTRGLKIQVMPGKQVLSAAKLLEVFAVDADTPWLCGVLAVLAGREEAAKERLMISNMPDYERAFNSGRLAESAEAQEEILELVNKGNEAKRGERRDASRQRPDASRRSG